MKKTVVNGIKYEVPVHIRRVPGAWQVCIERKSRPFHMSFKDKGNTKDALERAVSCKDRAIKLAPPMKHKCVNNVKNGHHSTGIRGVSISITKARDKRRTSMSVSVTDGTVGGSSFHVGPVEDVTTGLIARVLTKAYAHRREYERSVNRLETKVQDLYLVAYLVFSQYC